MDINKISRTDWNYKCHVISALNYRKQAFYGRKTIGIGTMLKHLCYWKNILEAEVCIYHVHMLLEMP